jgi:hypothetical protein
MQDSGDPAVCTSQSLALDALDSGAPRGCTGTRKLRTHARICRYSENLSNQGIGAGMAASGKHRASPALFGAPDDPEVAALFPVEPAQGRINTPVQVRLPSRE